MSRPRVGIPTIYERPPESEANEGPRPRLRLPAAYAEAVVAAGGLPVLLPAVAGDGLVAELLDGVDAVLMPGGRDISPQRLGQPPHERTEALHPRGERAFFELLAEADRRALPVLGICLGIQVIAAHRGGRLCQHLYELDRPAQIDHGRWPRETFHEVEVAPDSRLAAILGATRVEVNSTHHQCVVEPGRGLRAVARCVDGVVEAIESTDRRFVLGVQWHPERYPDRAEYLSVFEALVAAAGRRS